MPPLPTDHFTLDTPPMLLGAADGLSFIDTSTVLTRQWFFDGKFLRAAGFRTDQAYVRALVALSNTALGTGVVHGFDVSLLGGDRLRVGAGLALTPGGNLAYRPSALDVRISDLLAASAGVFDPGTTPHGDGPATFHDCPPGTPASEVGVEQAAGLLLLTVDDAGALCGQEERFGALCDDACDVDADRSHAVDGITLRLVPMVLELPNPEGVDLTGRHLRGRAASAWYARERTGVVSMISGSGLRGAVWCSGAPGLADGAVPLALLDRRGGVTTWVDQWIARRELMETPPARYWAWRMAMRPRDVFLAQVLQFQCQLLETPVDGGGEDGGVDDCREALTEAGELLGRLSGMSPTTGGTVSPGRGAEVTTGEQPPSTGGLEEGAAERMARLGKLSAAHSEAVGRLVERISAYLDRSVVTGSGSGLLDLGMLDTPSAGYLPVDPSGSVRRQVRELFGPGVDLRFCAVRPDFVPEAFWEAQHMDRISLTRGLHSPEEREEVDVLVPDGVVRESSRGPISQVLGGTILVGRPQRLHRAGEEIGRRDLDAVLRTVWGPRPEVTLIAGRNTDEDERLELLLWVTMTIDDDPLALEVGRSVGWTGHAHVQQERDGQTVSATDVTAQGMLTVVGRPAAGVVETQLNGQMRRVSSADSGAVQVQPLPQARIRWTRRSDDGVVAHLLGTGPNGVEAQVGQAVLERGSASFGASDEDVVGTFDRVIPDLTRSTTWPDVQRALDQIQQGRDVLGLRDDEFRADAEDRLVGPRGGGGTTEELTATRDWVMFHRRRTKRCAGVVAPETVVRLRRYAVLHEELDLDVVAPPPMTRPGGGALPRIDLAQFTLDDERGTVAFEEGGTDVRESSEVVRRWVADGLGAHDLVAMELVATRPESETVQRGRLLAIESALPHARTVTPATRVGRDVLPERWRELLAGTDVDGLVLLGTVRRRKPVEPVEPAPSYSVRVFVTDAVELRSRIREIMQLGEVPGVDELQEILGTDDAFDAHFTDDQWENPDEAVDGIAAAATGLWLPTTSGAEEGVATEELMANVLQQLEVRSGAEAMTDVTVDDDERVAVLVLGMR